MKVKVFEIVNQSILANSFHEPFIKIGDHKIDSNRDLNIYTWGKLKNIPVECRLLCWASYGILLFEVVFNSEGQ